MILRSESTRITPTMAVEYLSRAAPNRSRRKAVVQKYARDMSEGRWLVTGEPILFSGAGELLDGQHRLAAIVESRSTIEFLVVRGIQPDAIQVMGSGMSRTFADTLSIKGTCTTTLASVVAALTRRCYLFDAGIYVQAGMSALASYSELASYLADHGELLDHARYGQQQPRPNIAATTMAYLVTLGDRIDTDRAFEFCDRLRDGVGLMSGSPILALRDRLVRTEAFQMPTNNGVEVKIALCLSALGAYLEDRTLTKLQLPKGGLTNKTYPLPKGLRKS